MRMMSWRAIAPIALGMVACGPMTEEEQSTEGAELSSRYSDAANAPIPDDNATGVVREILVEQAWDLIQQLRVSVSVRHTYRGDLRVTLAAPNGREVVLHDQTGGSTDNLTIDRVIHDFDGQRIGGFWDLRVSDLAAQDTGVLVSWALAVETVPGPTPCDTTACDAGTHCELEEVQCVQAPCWPVPVCVPDAEDVCAGHACPVGQHCEPQVIYCVMAPCPPAVPECVADAAWHQEAADFGTTNPYRNSQRLSQSFTAPADATRLKLHFDRFETEQGYDFVTVLGANGAVLARWSGRLSDMAPELNVTPGAQVQVVFTSDSSITGAGFHIQAISWWRG